MDAPQNTEGARSATGGGGRKRGAWLALLLALLALLVVGGLLLASRGGDDGEQQAQSTTTAAPAEEEGTEDQGGGPTGSEPGVDGTPATESASAGGAGLLAGGLALLPVGSEARGLVGETATGTALRVLSVTDQGFFVGTEDPGSGAAGGGGRDRVYIELGGAVGEDEGEARPAEGDVVDLRGEVRPAPQDPGRTLRLSDEDAGLVREQGIFVNATSVEPHGG